LRVLLVAGEYPPHMFGGGATFMYNLARGLVKSGVEVTVVAHRLSRTLFRNTFVEFDKDGNLRIVWVTIPSYVYPRHVTFQLYVKSLIQTFSSRHDVIHINTGLYYPFLRPVFTNIGKPVIVTIHGDPVTVYKIALKLKSGLLSKVYGALHMLESINALRYELSELIPVFVGKHVKETLSKVFKISKQFAIIYNGIDFTVLQKALETPPKTKYFELLVKAKLQGYKILVYPARLHSIKNHLLLIIALSKLVRKNKQILLILAGEGPTKNFIERVSIRLQVENNVILAGRLPYDETIRLMSLADLIPFPSLYEACPLSLIEALWLGKKVIAFDLPYIHEIRHENILVAKTPEEFIELLEEALSLNFRLAIGKHSLNESKLLEKFSVNHMVARYLELYRRVIGERYG
jgi:glycosyltransferase involved in cell wall biosynthesis